MRKIRLYQSLIMWLPASGKTFPSPLFSTDYTKNFHDSNWRNDALKSINAYAACNFPLIHLTLQMPK